MTRDLFWFDLAGTAIIVVTGAVGFWRKNPDVCFGGTAAAGLVYFAADVLSLRGTGRLVDIGIELLMLILVISVWRSCRRYLRRVAAEAAAEIEADEARRAAAVRYLMRRWN